MSLIDDTQTSNENRELRTPSAFLPYQSRWSEDRAQVKLWEKSRRIGASWGEAGENTLLAASEHGMDVFYIGYTKDMAIEFIEDCAAWARHYKLAAGAVEEFVFKETDKTGGEREIQAFRIRFASGFKIEALSSRPRNLRGKQGKIVIDEAAFHDDLPGLVKAAIAMLMWGGRVVIISTHNGEESHFNELITLIRAGKVPYSLHRTTLDDALAEGLYQRICLRLGQTWSKTAEEKWRQDLLDQYGEDANEELLCIPARGGGIYLPRNLVEACMSPDIPVIRLACKTSFAQEPDWIRAKTIRQWCDENLKPVLAVMRQDVLSYLGEDFGRSGDLSVQLPLCEYRNLSYRAPFVVELRNVPFTEQEFILKYLCDRLPRFCGAALDARGNGQYLAERAMQYYGAHRILQVMLSQEWYRDNMPRYKQAFEDRNIMLPKDGDILDDHRAVRMDKGVAKVPWSGKGRDGGQRHGDSAIAGALALYAATNLAGFYEIPPVRSSSLRSMTRETDAFHGRVNYGMMN